MVKPVDVLHFSASFSSHSIVFFINKMIEVVDLVINSLTQLPESSIWPKLTSVSR